MKYLKEINKTYMINDSTINQIIKESVNSFLLKETHTQNLYHYINAQNLISLLKRNAMRTSNPETYLDSNLTKKYVNGEKERFISLTRNKNGKEGYPVLKYGPCGDGDTSVVIRLDIDGEYFNRGNLKKIDKRYKNGYKRIKTKIKPIDWAYYDMAKCGDPMAMADTTNGIFASNGKEWQMQSDDYDDYNPIKGYATDRYNHPMSQAEDRLTSNEKYIPNANKYIKGIDIYIDSRFFNKKDLSTLYKINSYAQQDGITVNFYDDFDDFSLQNVNNSFDIDGASMMIYN